MTGRMSAAIMGGVPSRRCRLSRMQQWLASLARPFAAISTAAFLAACGGSDTVASAPVAREIRQVLDKPAYSKAVWGLRVVDLDTGEVLQDLDGDRPLKVGSVRKLFSVGLALDALGPDHLFRTPIHRQGTTDAPGVLRGNLVLVASGDLAMGGRTLPDGSFAISDYDHNEANSLGNAVLTTPDPLAGFDRLARQVAAAGITRVEGDVVVDTRLFEPFDFRGEFKVGAMFVNDDVVDVSIGPDGAMDWRPKSAAFPVSSTLALAAAGSPFEVDLDPESPACLGAVGCGGRISGSLPAGFVPPLTGRFPLIRTFRITDPATYARSVLIEALARAGVSVSAPVVAANPVRLLPSSRAYDPATRVAELVSQPFRDYARHILKVSYNIGADTSLMLLGLTRGETTQAGALAAERTLLESRYGVAADQVTFVDGSGGGDTASTGKAVIGILRAMASGPNAQVFRAALPGLGVDGSLAFVNDFAGDPSLAGARGQVQAKTGTYLTGGDAGAVLAAQALAGYVTARSGRRLAFEVVVNGVAPIGGLDEVIQVFQDQGTIAAILWKLY